MSKRKTAYELGRSQVSTPAPVVELFWRITHNYRGCFDSVLDLGAGDGRFFTGGNFNRYEGVEIDRSRKLIRGFGANASMTYGCAFRHKGTGYDVCVGNPPYVRHHDLDEAWRNRIARDLESQTACTMNRKCNLFVYFMFLSLLKAKSDGLVSLIVPYEWVSRPSTKPLRRYIELNRWHVDAYRLPEGLFGDVLTTASVSVIDKRNCDAAWQFYDIDLSGKVDARPYVSGAVAVMPYRDRGEIWAMRGMSPGTQKVFTLTEGQRLHAGLTHEDLVPCVTSLRHVPRSISRLNQASFRRYFINAGARCWLIRSFDTAMSRRLRAYLESIRPSDRNTSTCTSRPVWYLYDLTPPGRLLLSTAFVKFGPKVLINSVRAHSLGSVCGIYAPRPVRVTALGDFLLGIDFESRIVPHSNGLKKIEIRQLNGVLQSFAEPER